MSRPRSNSTVRRGCRRCSCPRNRSMRCSGRTRTTFSTRARSLTCSPVRSPSKPTATQPGSGSVSRTNCIQNAKQPSCSTLAYRSFAGGSNETSDRTDCGGGWFYCTWLDCRADGSGAASGLRDQDRVSSRYTTVTCTRGCGLQFIRVTPDKSKAERSFTYTCGGGNAPNCGGIRPRLGDPVGHASSGARQSPQLPAAPSSLHPAAPLISCFAHAAEQRHVLRPPAAMKTHLPRCKFRGGFCSYRPPP